MSTTDATPDDLETIANDLPSWETCERAGLDPSGRIGPYGTGPGGLFSWEDVAKYLLATFTPEPENLDRCANGCVCTDAEKADARGDYTAIPTRVRIYFTDCGDEYPWHVDGAEDDPGDYTADVRRFATWAEALAVVPDFVRETTASGVRWHWRGKPRTAAERAKWNSV